MKFGSSNKSPYVSNVVNAEEPADQRSLLGEGCEINGEVRFSDIMRVDANIFGTIYSDTGSLVIMEKGCIKATVQAAVVEVSGVVEGTITAKTSVKIHSTGRVYGDIYTPALMIEHGAVFDGKCHMLETKSNSPKDYAGSEQKSAPDASNLKMVDAV